MLMGFPHFLTLPGHHFGHKNFILWRMAKNRYYGGQILALFGVDFVTPFLHQNVSPKCPKTRTPKIGVQFISISASQQANDVSENMIFAHTFFTKLDTKKMSKTCTQKWTLFVTTFWHLSDPPEILVSPSKISHFFTKFSLSASLWVQKGVQKTTFFCHFWPLLDPFLGRTESKFGLLARPLNLDPQKSWMTKPGPPGWPKVDLGDQNLTLGCQNWTLEMSKSTFWTFFENLGLQNRMDSSGFFSILSLLTILTKLGSRKSLFFTFLAIFPKIFQIPLSMQAKF